MYGYALKFKQLIVDLGTKIGNENGWHHHCLVKKMLFCIEDEINAGAMVHFFGLAFNKSRVRIHQQKAYT